MEKTEPISLEKITPSLNSQSGQEPIPNEPLPNKTEGIWSFVESDVWLVAEK